MFLKRRSFFKKYSKILYLPIEVYSRDFQAKLHLAYQACQRGWTVVIGPEYDVNKLVRYLPSGVYFGNGFHKKATKISKIIKNSGHYVLMQDEEGLVRWTQDLYKEYRINSEIYNYIDFFLCWGEEDKKIIQSTFKKPIKAEAIGNLKFDLLSPDLRKLFKEKVNEIINNYGDFILINGNFGSTNHALGEDYYVNEIKLRGWLDTPSKKKYQLERIAFQRSIFKKIIELSIAIADTGQKVIVRPHPSENIEVWKKETKNCSKNIKVIRSGNIIPWLIASKLVIHNNCSTAIEAMLLDKTVISYRPFKNPRAETYLPNAISKCIENKENIINYLKNFSANKDYINQKNSLDILYQYLKKNKTEENASSRIIDLIEKLSLKKNNKKNNSFKDNIKIELSLLKSMITRVIFKKNFLYLKKKCPKLDKNETNKILEIFSLNNYDRCNLETINLTKHSLVIQAKEKKK